MDIVAGSWATRVVATAVVATDGTGDFTTIQAAINSLPSTGGVVYIKEGTYTITSAITISIDNVVLIGAGASTIIQTSGNIPAISVSSHDRLRFNNLRVIGSGSGNSSNQGIKLSSCDKCIISECWFEDCGASSIQIGTSTDFKIINCFFIGLTSYGPEIIESTKGVIHGNTADRGIGVYAFTGTRPSNIIVSGNKVIGNTQGPGITVQKADQVRVVNNHSSGNLQDGIHFNDVTDCVIAGNVCEDNDSGEFATFNGIRLQAACDNNVIANNVCRNNDGYEITIQAATCDDNIILGNIVNGTDHVGAINDSGTNTEIAHNKA